MLLHWVFEYKIAFRMPGVLLIMMKDTIEHVKVADLGQGDPLLENYIHHTCVPKL